MEIINIKEFVFLGSESFAQLIRIYAICDLYCCTWHGAVENIAQLWPWKQKLDGKLTTGKNFCFDLYFPGLIRISLSLV